MTEDHRTLQRPDEAIGDLGASPGPADIADVVNPANDGSPAQGLANKVIENIQPNSNSAQNLSDALGNPATDDAPKLQDALEQPAEMLKPGREVSAMKACPLLPSTTWDRKVHRLYMCEPFFSCLCCMLSCKESRWPTSR